MEAMITVEEELIVYRNILQTFYIARRITLDSNKVSFLLDAIDSWERSADYHSQSQEEYNNYREKAFQKLRDSTFS